MEKQFLEQIVRHLNDSENDAARVEVAAWRNESDENEKLFLTLQRIWDGSAELRNFPVVDVEAATERLNERLRLSDRFTENIDQSRFTSWFWRIAAAISFFCLAWWSYSKFTSVHYLTLATSVNVDSVKLADGSRIYLDGKTTILYPDRVKGDERRVFLTRGNAFFKVKKDASRPFIIDLGNSTVTVLGTSFNILLTEKEIEVSVSEGTVRFDAATTNASTVTAGRGIVYHRNSGQVDNVDVTNTNAASWLTRDLNFQDASLAEVLNAIEKMYKVNIRLDDSISDFKKFNAKFHGDNLQEVIEVLQATYPIDVRREDSLLIVKSARAK